MLAYIHRPIPNIEQRVNLKNLSWGTSFVAEHNNNLKACNDSGTTISHWEVFKPLVQSASFRIFQIMPLNRLHWDLPLGLYTEENALAISLSLRNGSISLDTKHLALLLCIMARKLNKLNNKFKHEITVRERTSLQENTNGNLENSSTTVKR